MKVLLIGDGNSRFVRDYINVLTKSADSDIGVDLFSMTSPVRNPDEIRIYNLYQANILTILPSFKLFLISFRILALISLLYRKRNEYDLIHIHFVFPDIASLFWLFKFIKAELIITVYGSDYYRVSTYKRKLLKFLFGKSSYVTFANEQTRQDFIAYYRFPEEKTRICRFGLSPLALIMEPGTYELKDCRGVLGLPENKVLICIGYNSNRNQQHLEVIRMLSNDAELIRNRDAIHFIFPMTYGSAGNYRNEVLHALQTFPFSQTVLLDYLPEDKNALLRMACDIMIQVQQTDQFSGTMQEHLCAGNCVITGSWLPYKAFEDCGIRFRKIQSLAELAETLRNCLANLEEEKRIASGNFRLIHELSNWKNTIGDWIALYHQIKRPDL